MSCRQAADLCKKSMSGSMGLDSWNELVACRSQALDEIPSSEGMCCLQAAAEVVYVPDMQGPESATLMGAVGVRLRAALRSPSPPLVCSAARTAGQ